MVELKHDGFRCLFTRGIDGKPGLWTRNGMPIQGCDHILHRLTMFEESAGGPLFIDGELVVDGTLAATKAWVERGHKLGGEAGVFHAFDMLPYPDWRAGGSPTPLYARKSALQHLSAQVETEAANRWEWRPGSRGRDDTAIPVRVVLDEWATDAADVLDLARRVWADNGEGVMVKDAEAPYCRTRNRSWLKVKSEAAWRYPIAA